MCWVANRLARVHRRYWITHEDADYNRLMEAVQEFIDNPQASTIK
jgi:hypothetical protein